MFDVIHQWICLKELYKLMNSIFQISFQNYGQKTKNIQKNREAWILIKLQCVVYQWICLNELYKVMNIFLNFKLVFEILTEKQKIFKRLEAWILIKVKCISYMYISDVMNICTRKCEYLQSFWHSHSRMWGKYFLRMRIFKMFLKLIVLEVETQLEKSLFQISFGNFGQKQNFFLKTQKYSIE